MVLLPQEIVDMISTMIDDAETVEAYCEVVPITENAIFRAMTRLKFSGFSDAFVRRHSGCLSRLVWRNVEEALSTGSIQYRPPDVQMIIYSKVTDCDWELVGMEYGFNRFQKVFPFLDDFKFIEDINRGKIMAVVEEVLGCD